VIDHDRPAGIQRPVVRTGGNRWPRVPVGSERLAKRARANDASMIGRIERAEPAAGAELVSPSQLTRGCSGPGRARIRTGRDIVDANKACAAAEPPR